MVNFRGPFRLAAGRTNAQIIQDVKERTGRQSPVHIKHLYIDKVSRLGRFFCEIFCRKAAGRGAMATHRSVPAQPRLRFNNGSIRQGIVAKCPGFSAVPRSAINRPIVDCWIKKIVPDDASVGPRLVTTNTLRDEIYQRDSE
jgi:hypothetical protein